MSCKIVTQSLADGVVQLAILCIYVQEESQLRFSNSKHFRFYSTEETFHFRMIFPKKPWDWESCLVVRKAKKIWDSWQNQENREFGPAWGVEEQLLISSSFLSPGPVEKLQKFINFCLKVGYSANLKHSKSTWTTYHPVKGTKS